jgi:hypothetical protein
MRTAAQYYKAVAILTLNTLVIFACLDLGAMAYLRVRSTVSGPEQGVRDAREKSSFYVSKNWAAQYWKEFAQSRKQRYHAYTVWRRALFKGETINVDEDGIRFTPGSDCRPNAFKVFTFGGSPMWGTGSPDWATIPAYLEPGLESWKQRPICLKNYGESAYVSTQSVIELILQVQSGNKPDVAIFYDGTNDIYTAYQSGKSGVHENLEQIAARMERRDLPRSPLYAQLLESFSLFTLIDLEVSHLSGDSRPAPKPITYETMNVDMKSLTDSITTTYLANYDAVGALAEKYGFEYHFFWPPRMSSSKKPLTTEEEDLKRAVDPSLEKLYEAVYQAMGPSVISRYKKLHSMTDVFDKTQSLIWLDDVHVTPVGNEMIADRMLQVITGGVPEGISTKGSHEHKDAVTAYLQ